MCLAAVCTLAHADGGSGGGSGGGTGGGAAVTDAGTPRCASTPVTCSDQISADLDLKATANVATLTNAAEGTGFKSTVDTRAGGVPPSLSYVYAVFTETGLQAVNLSDEAALSSLAWDIAFRRFVIRLNGGSSGPSCVDAAKTSAAYDPLIAPPAGLSYVVDDFVGPPGGAGDAGCAFKDDGSGLTSSPSTALASFYRYNNCVAMSGQVFVVRTRLGRDVKLTVTSYYDT